MKKTLTFLGRRASRLKPRAFGAGALLAVGAIAFGNAHADSPWAATATQALGTKLVNATLLGATDLSTPVHVVLGLNLHNKSELSQYIGHITSKGDSLFGTYLSGAAFKARYSPTATDAQAVKAYLQNAGFSNVRIESNNLLVSGDGTVALAQAAFNTKIANYRQFGRTVFANTLPAQIPAALSQTVISVQGLTNANRLQLLTRQGGPSLPSQVPQFLPAALGPQNFWKAYNVGTTGTGTPTTTIAIMTEGDTAPLLSDLAVFENTYGLPRIPVTVVKTNGDSTDTSGQTEFDMDMQTSTGMAGNVKSLVLYNMPSMLTTEMTTALNRFVADNSAKAMSASLGYCEALALVTGDAAIDDQILMQAVAQGQTFFVSSGDTGPTCPAPAVGGATNGVADTGPIPGQEYPAASPYAIAVGGTTLLINNDGSYNSEIAWNAGGGGFSTIETAAPWQTPSLYPLLPVSGLPVPRGVPDIAMDADFLLSAAAFFQNGAATSNGGTSLAAPLSLGSWARIANAHNNNVGFAGPLLYQLASPPSVTNPVPAVAATNDIVLGNNGGYSAAPGYDLTTGLGSFDITAVSTAITQMLH